MIGTKGRYRVTATLRLRDGYERVEDLGVHEATMGRKAKARAIAMHAGRMGWRSTTRGINTRGWTFRIELVKDGTS